MSTHAYHKVFNQVQHLPIEEQLQLLVDLAILVQQQKAVEPLHSILELEGLGAEIWQGVDVEKYIDEERNSWDG